MRTRFFLLLFPLLSTPLPVLAASQCDGTPVDSSLPDGQRADQLAKRAFACVKERKPVQSIALFSELISIEPNNFHAYLNRGSTYVRMGELDAGLKDYSHVIELEPDHFEGWYNRGSSRLVARQYDEAIFDLTEAIRLKPDLRLEWRGQDGQEKAEQCKHCALTLGDSFSRSNADEVFGTHRCQLAA
jgi:tetratricopeptide (TPR) repeat protein